VIQAYLRRNYVRLIERLLMGHGLVAIATHDQQILRYALRFIAREGVPRERYEFEMLYGVRRDLQRALARRGEPVRTYVPFGREWYPYLVRRLAERPANLMFVLTSLVREWRVSRL